MLEGDQLRCARLATRSLAEVVETSFGPQPREKLLVSAVGRVLITSSGASILRSLVTEPAESPVARYIIDCALRHAERAGEGATAFILMADAALCSIDAVLAPLPPARRSRHVVAQGQMWHLGRADDAGGSGAVDEPVLDDLEVASVGSAHSDLAPRRPDSPLRSFTPAAPNGKLARLAQRLPVPLHQQRIGWG